MDSPDSPVEMHAPASTEHGHDSHGSPGGFVDTHAPTTFLRKYVFSIDHKVIGIQYMVTSFVFLFIGFSFMLLMRWQLAYPNTPLTVPNFAKHMVMVFPDFGNYVYDHYIADAPPAPVAAPPAVDVAKTKDDAAKPLVERLLGDKNMPNGIMTASFYNQLGAMHGTVMVFLAIVPLAFGAFGNYLVPIQIGAPDMAFPRLNMMSYWLNFAGGVSMMISFFIPGGAAQSGWTSYPPLSIINPGQTMWLVSMVFLITSSLLGSVNIITTVVQLRAPGMTWMRLPFFTWTQFVTAFLLLLAFPPLESAAVLQLMDRLFGTSFFMPTGLVVNGIPMADYSGGGSPLLWQHLFWFLAHPEVYVLILPGLGIISEVIANNTRKPLWGYNTLVGSIFFLGFCSFFVWAHHMYLTGMNTKVSGFFQTTTTIISIPSVIIITALLISLWGGSIRFTVPMLFACAFLPMFGIGGFTGIPLAYNASDFVLHDTYYVIGHFHYIVAPGTIFALFAGTYYWYPKATGRMMNQFWGKVHFWPTLVCMNFIFFPMFLQGMSGMHRRWYDGGQTFRELMAGVLHWNEFISVAAFVMAFAQIPFIINFCTSWKYGKKVGRNPWDATTLEWTAPSPPPTINFEEPPTVYRGPYEYSVPGAPRDFVMQGDAHGTASPVKKPGDH